MKKDDCRITCVLALAVGSVSVFAILGHVSGNTFLYELGMEPGMAINTAVSFILVSVALLIVAKR